MKIKSFVAAIVFALALVGCKSVPADVRAAHDESMTFSANAFDVAEDVIAKVREPVAELNDELVAEAYALWVFNISNLLSKRAIVLTYLESDEPELVDSFTVGNQLIADLAFNFRDVKDNWENIATYPDRDKVNTYLDQFARDFDRFRELERKFDEWIKQFPVKG